MPLTKSEDPAGSKNRSGIGRYGAPLSVEEKCLPSAAIINPNYADKCPRAPMFDGEPVIMVDDSAIIRSNPRYRHCLIIYHAAEIKKLSLPRHDCKSSFQLRHGADIRWTNNK